MKKCFFLQKNTIRDIKSRKWLYTRIHTLIVIKE
jgi:hypothetical protein